ncbi:Arabinanase/levansucrase/invertase [Mycena amicta]|nr:Arabinanase/levansucrase/invertase [Mycena amicta]
MLASSWIRAAVALACASNALAAVSWIVPGAIWTDTAGVKIDAHGGMITKPGDGVGQGDSDNVSPRIYSSRDLLNWDNVGLAAPNITQMWRPKLFSLGGRFWIWGQVDRLIQPLRSTSVTGGYTAFGTSFSIPPSGWTYSDGGLFVDDDGSTYFLTSADHNNIAISSINADGGTIGARIAAVEEGALEAPGMLKSNGVYYLIVSGKTGYRANPDTSFWATSLAGPWSGPSDIAPEATNTYNSQNTFELKIAGTTTTTWIYMGDAWDSTGSAASNYEWLPISINNAAHTVTLQNFAMWKINPTTGVVSTPTAGKRYEAEDAQLAGRAAITDCESCISKRSVHRIDQGSNVTFTGIEGIGEKQWVALHYTVNNRTAGDAHVHVNGREAERFHKTVVVGIHLKRGSDNTITFAPEGDDDFEAHLDGIEVWDGTESEVVREL